MKWTLQNIWQNKPPMQSCTASYVSCKQELQEIRLTVVEHISWHYFAYEQQEKILEKMKAEKIFFQQTKYIYLIKEREVLSPSTIPRGLQMCAYLEIRTALNQHIYSEKRDAFSLLTTMIKFVLWLLE